MQNQVITIIYASTVAVRTTHLATVPADQTTTERNLGQHQGTSKIMDSGIQVMFRILKKRQTIFCTRTIGLTKTGVVINRQDLMKGLIGNTRLITITTNHLH